MSRRFFLGLALAAGLASAGSPALAQGPSQTTWNAPYTKSVPLSVGVPVPPNFGSGAFLIPVRAVLISCTVAGNITLQLSDGSQITLSSLPPGIYVLPMQVVEVVSSTATATFSALG